MYMVSKFNICTLRWTFDERFSIFFFCFLFVYQLTTISGKPRNSLVDNDYSANSDHPHKTASTTTSASVHMAIEQDQHLLIQRIFKHCKVTLIFVHSVGWLNLFCYFSLFYFTFKNMYINKTNKINICQRINWILIFINSKLFQCFVFIQFYLIEQPCALFIIILSFRMLDCTFLYTIYFNWMHAIWKFISTFFWFYILLSYVFAFWTLVISVLKINLFNDFTVKPLKCMLLWMTKYVTTTFRYLKTFLFFALFQFNFNCK